jgi:archaellum component FlaF (FlaF/FlaG flagellin family)
METLHLIMIITAFVLLILLFASAVNENEKLQKQNRDQKYDIRKLTKENIELMDEIFELNKTIRTTEK